MADKKPSEKAYDHVVQHQKEHPPVPPPQYHPSKVIIVQVCQAADGGCAWKCDHLPISEWPAKTGQTVVCDRCAAKINNEDFVVMSDAEAQSNAAAKIYAKRVAAAGRKTIWLGPDGEQL